MVNSKPLQGTLEKPKPLHECMTAAQWSFVKKQRILQVLDTMMHDLSGPAHHLSYIDQCRGDMGIMAIHYGRVQSVNNVRQLLCIVHRHTVEPACQRPCLACRAESLRGGALQLLHCFLAPIVGSLSDSWGRRKLHAYGKLGPMFWFLGLIVMTKYYSASPSNAIVRSRSLLLRFALEMIPWGTFMAGNWGLFASQHADYFAEQSELSARIQACVNRLYQRSAARQIGPELHL
eukprot:SAG11_NODE_1606_length_4591_cov_1.769813_5_plen_233_part_00